ncbi:MAG TPA: class I SAM-dependent methyltransferase [Pyrinomonadaceae bacterium]|jgi:SAM-dependent methyltransferase|nr:class I SAM-dependent methyltransferase [Pyrinomonadaceae bacterium]
MNADPTRRFSNRVGDYIKYRPSYPRALVALLEDECGLTRESVVADVGSGTGILSELFLREGYRVYGVEPNREMREAGEQFLAAYQNFVSVDGRAEETALDDNSADFVTAGQAFHWFDPAAARREFRRILKYDGWAVLVWNDRRTEGTPLLAEYERLLLEYGTDYKEVSSKWAAEENIKTLFGDTEVRAKTFDNEQVLDFDGLKGRLMSASYAPVPGHPNHEPLMRELAALFHRHQRDGRVVVEYDTKVFYGHLT